MTTRTAAVRPPVWPRGRRGPDARRFIALGVVLTGLVAGAAGWHTVAAAPAPAPLPGSENCVMCHEGAPKAARRVPETAPPYDPAALRASPHAGL